ncbi:M23 family metallopeptidase [Candidatus Woesearchaeota archaeon]|nr:M23 family metallopeptidase [Candidatus Woesearchaeota archaeon]
MWELFGNLMMTYIIPLPEDVQFVILNPEGRFTHENFIESKYAIDFGVPIGTPVIASRGGKVGMVKDDSQEWGLDATFEDTNLVVIDHPDGTSAEYLHLGYKQVSVRKNQNVEQGEILGLTGNSGVMDIPHLHFNVFLTKKTKSIPVEFG